mgnify:CR=1 FL=1
MNFPMWLIRLSIWVNDRTGGPKGYSLCARFWEGRLNGSRVHTAWVWATDTIFFFDPDHCRKAWLLRRKDQ